MLCIPNPVVTVVLAPSFGMSATAVIVNNRTAEALLKSVVHSVGSVASIGVLTMHNIVPTPYDAEYPLPTVPSRDIWPVSGSDRMSRWSELDELPLTS